MTPTPIRIVSGGYELAATRYGFGGRCLLVLYPFAEERKGVVRPASELARRMAEDGWNVILFDYAGTGESPGAFSDLTWETLQQNVRDALDSCEGPVSILAIRLGARLALDVLSTGNYPVQSFACWEPVLDGAGWLREIRRRSRFRQGGACDDPLDIDGYRLHRDLAETLESMSGMSKSSGAPCWIGCVAHRGRPTATMERIAAHMNATVDAVIRQPFWLETGVVDADVLLDSTIDALNRPGDPPT